MTGSGRMAGLLILALMAVCRGVGLSQADDRMSKDHRLFAAVFMVRGSVSGSSAGEFGAFVRDNPVDTSWTKITSSNIFTFGLGYFSHGQTRRYYVAAGNGLHRSTDGGASWKIMTSWRTMEVLSVVPDPVDSAVITISTPWGIFQTTDDGGTWEKKMEGMKRWYVEMLIMHPGDRRTLYAASEDDLYVSRDRGEHWKPLNVGSAPVLTIHQLVANPTVMLVGVEDGGLRRTTNGGETWSVARGLDSSSVYCITSSPDGRELYAGGWKTGVWRSIDRGASWSPVWADPSVEAVFCIFVHPENPRHLLVGTDGQGILESRDGGTTWTRAGISGGKIKQIAFYPYQ
jgi:photosystem II stability/assembly factor-like uncharacterized protein